MNNQTTTRLIPTIAGVLLTAVFGQAGALEAAAPVPPFERLALISLYEQTNGAEWFHTTNWLTPDGSSFNAPGTECTWYGVTCDASPAVVAINLDNNNLSGQIPIEIANLKSLTYLQLSSNRLTGSVPPELGTLLELEWLELSSNQLTGTIPPELGLLYSIWWLKVNDNQLTGSIPPEFGYLSNLEYLGLSKNQLGGTVPRELGNLTWLAQLQLDSNRLRGNIPAEITNLTELKDGSGLSSRWNAVYTDDSSVDAFVAQKHNFWGDWHVTQTVAPAVLEITAIRDASAWLSWNVIDGQTEPGGYEVFYAPVGTEDWVSAGWTWNKNEDNFPVTGLEPGTTYDFAVMEFTLAHENNPNAIDSDLSAPTTGTTASLACSPPVITVDTNGLPFTLSVSGDYSTYRWSTGEETATIEVNPASAGWFWVTVTGAGSCEEAASVLVDPSAVSDVIFSDGFESGNISEWS